MIWNFYLCQLQLQPEKIKILNTIPANLVNFFLNVAFFPLNTEQFCSIDKMFFFWYVVISGYTNLNKNGGSNQNTLNMCKYIYSYTTYREMQYVAQL